MLLSILRQDRLQLISFLELIKYKVEVLSLRVMDLPAMLAMD